MALPFRHDLERALAEFADSHRGLRMSRTFGAAAAFAGRRMFACVVDDGLACRVSAAVARRELRYGARPFAPSVGPAATRRRPRSGWIFYRPARGILTARIARALEEGARLAAELSVAGPRPSDAAPRPSKTKAGKKR